MTYRITTGKNFDAFTKWVKKGFSFSYKIAKILMQKRTILELFKTWELGCWFYDPAITLSFLSWSTSWQLVVLLHSNKSFCFLTPWRSGESFTGHGEGLSIAFFVIFFFKSILRVQGKVSPWSLHVNRAGETLFEIANFVRTDQTV